MPAPDRSRALDHIVVVLFENRSLDNVLGHLYGPPDGKTFDGVIGQALSSLGKGLVPAFIAMARQLGVPLPAELNDPEAALPPGHVVGVLRDIAGHFFPLLAADAKDLR